MLAIYAHQGGKMPSQGEDMAVLSLCDHSIIGVRFGFPFSHFSIIGKISQSDLRNADGHLNGT